MGSGLRGETREAGGGVWGELWLKCKNAMKENYRNKNSSSIPPNLISSLGDRKGWDHRFRNSQASGSAQLYVQRL